MSSNDVQMGGGNPSKKRGRSNSAPPDPVRTQPKRQAKGLSDEVVAKLQPLKKDLKELSKPGGKGRKATHADATKAERRAIQSDGRAQGGCHECGKRSHGTTWVADHNPPKGLTSAGEKCLHKINNAKVDAVLKSGKYVFRPHCAACSKAQSALVAKINAGNLKSLSSMQVKLIAGGYDKCIDGQAGAASEHQRMEIQRLGAELGCHSCGNSELSYVYIADHVPPKRLVGGSMNSVYEALDLEVPRTMVFKPQCVSCMKAQATRVSALRVSIDKILGGE